LKVLLRIFSANSSSTILSINVFASKVIPLTIAQ
jgi:hypothetical protein